MDPLIQSKLIECLDALYQGQSIEQVLAQHPLEQEQLRPLLETALKLTEFSLQPTLAAQSRSRQAFLDEADALSRVSRARPTPFAWLQRLLLPVAALVMLLMLGAGVISMSASTVPGDSLYGTKRVAEALQMALTADVTQRADLTERFRRERIAEIQQLLAAGRDADVEFSGPIQRIQEDTWLIAGLNTQTNDATQISGPVQVSNTAFVAGQVSAGKLTATAIKVVAVPRPLPQPTPTPPAPPTPMTPATFTPTAEPVDESQPLPAATATPEAKPTITSVPVTSMPPEPTSAPPTAGDDNSNDDNDSDSSSDDSGHNESDDENSNHSSGDDNSNDDQSDGSDNRGSGNEEDSSHNENDNSDDSSGSGSGSGDNETEENSSNVEEDEGGRG